MSMYVYLRVTISSSYIFDAVFRKIWLALTQYEAHGQTAPRANTCARSSCRARAPGHIANDSAERRTGFYLPSDDWVSLDADTIPEGVPSQLKPRYTWSERSLRLAASWGVLGLCALFSVMLQLALLLARSWFILHLNNPIGGHVLASLLTALAVELMQAAFHPLVEALCEWQNHRSAHIYERHHAAQLFSLSFINRFFTPLYLALLKKLGAFALFHGGAYPLTLAAATMSYLFGTDHPGSYLLEICRDRQGLPSDGCVEELATQIGALLLVLLPQLSRL